MENKPLVSLIVLFYNQERFVKDAVMGALSQDYENCEIILSDDCSTDNTFSVIKQLVSEYKGTKKIIVNKNEKNLGLVRHVNKALFDLSHGDIICLAGGDDISLSNRVSDTVNYFQSNSNLTAVTMSYHIIDQNGNITGKGLVNKDEILKIVDKKYLTSSRGMMWGLSGLAFSRIVLDIFGKLNEDCQTEDSVLRFRSILIGEVLTSAKIGLKYRIHGNNMSIGTVIFKLKTEPIAKQYEKDFEVAKQYLNSKVVNILKQKIKFYARYRNYCEKRAVGNFFVKCFMLLLKPISVWYYKCKISWILGNKLSACKMKIWHLYNLLYYITNKKKLVVISASMQSKGCKANPINFGDDINYDIVSYLSGGKKVINLTKNVLFYRIINSVNYSCIGSLSDFGFLNKNTIVWGTGSMYGDVEKIGIPKKILAVRGPLTRNCFIEKGVDCPEIYGDPALLLPMIYPCNEPKKYKYGLIPHFCDFNLQNVKYFQEKYKDSAIVIQLTNYKNWRDIVKQICQCEFIMSSSLHGLIVADAYNIPNIWIKLSNNIIGGDYKYQDYFLSVNRTQEHPIYLIGKDIIPENIISIHPYEPITFDRDKLLQVCPFISK